MLALLAALPLLAAPPEPAPQESEPPAGPTDAELRAAWEALEPLERRHVLDYLRLDLSSRGSFQRSLVDWVIEDSGRDPGAWPAAPAPTWFDPEVHAPAQPIPRRLVPADDGGAREVRSALERRDPERRLKSGWAYDWGTGDVVRLPSEPDLTRQFENALLGFPPDLDLAEALVLRALDDGSQRVALGALGHLYTDRAGRAFEGLTLYDAWSTGTEIEMPDIDVLGIVHTVLDEWKRWKAPVPTSKQQALYARVKEVYVDARNHRAPREALARTYLIAAPVYRDAYGPGMHERFHGLWEGVSSDPHALAEALPGPDGWNEYLADSLRELGEAEGLLDRTRARRATLAADEARVRERLGAVMVDMGLLGAPEPAPRREPVKRSQEAP